MMRVILAEVVQPKPLLLHPQVIAQVFSKRLAVLLEPELSRLSPLLAHHPQERATLLPDLSLLHLSTLVLSKLGLLWLWL